MEDILGGAFAPAVSEDCDYPDISMIKKTGVMPKIKSTIAADSVLKARLKSEELVCVNTYNHIYIYK